MAESLILEYFNLMLAERTGRTHDENRAIELEQQLNGYTTHTVQVIADAMAVIFEEKPR